MWSWFFIFFIFFVLIKPLSAQNFIIQGSQCSQSSYPLQYCNQNGSISFCSDGLWYSLDCSPGLTCYLDNLSGADCLPPPASSVYVSSIQTSLKSYTKTLALTSTQTSFYSVTSTPTSLPNSSLPSLDITKTFDTLGFKGFNVRLSIPSYVCTNGSQINLHLEAPEQSLLSYQSSNPYLSNITLQNNQVSISWSIPSDSSSNTSSKLVCDIVSYSSSTESEPDTKVKLQFFDLSVMTMDKFFYWKDGDFNASEVDSPDIVSNNVVVSSIVIMSRQSDTSSRIPDTKILIVFSAGLALFACGTVVFGWVAITGFRLRWLEK